MAPTPASMLSAKCRHAILVAVAGCLLFGSLNSKSATPVEGLCNEFPELRPSIEAHLSKVTSAAFVARITADPAYAAMLGNPVAERPPFADASPIFAYSINLTYPPLEDVDVITYRLQQTGEFDYVAPNNRNSCFIPPADTIAVFLEFYNSDLDHYFYSGNAQEIADIDAGKVGRWVRTGKSFRAVTAIGCIAGRTEGWVYRFYGTPGKGPNSHFFTRDRAECYVVDKSGQWSLEGVPFYANTPSVNADCDGRGLPLYRLWRPFGDSNHRFTTETSIIFEMVQKGWVNEGLAMCLTAY